MFNKCSALPAPGITIPIPINVQQIFVVTFEYPGAARGFMIMSCAARGVEKVGQHWGKRFVGPQAANIAHCACIQRQRQNFLNLIWEAA